MEASDGSNVWVRVRILHDLPHIMGNSINFKTATPEEMMTFFRSHVPQHIRKEFPEVGDEIKFTGVPKFFYPHFTNVA